MEQEMNPHTSHDSPMNITGTDASHVTERSILASGVSTADRSLVTETSSLLTERSDSMEVVARKLDAGQNLDYIPVESSRSNLKVVLIAYAKSRVDRVLKLSERLEILEDQLYSQVTQPGSMVDFKDVLAVTQLLSQSLNQAIQFIDKVSTSDNYVHLTFNDNRQILNQAVGLIGNVTTPEDLSLTRQSREKIRGVLEQFLGRAQEVEDVRSGDVIIPALSQSSSVIDVPVQSTSQKEEIIVATNIRVGQSVTYNNEKYRVESINSDGSLTLKYPGANQGTVTVPASAVAAELTEGRIDATKRLNG